MNETYKICDDQELRVLFVSAMTVRGLSYEAIAQKAQCAPGYLSKWARGNQKITSRLVIKIMAAVGCGDVEQCWKVPDES